MQRQIELHPSSYVILGLLSRVPEATPYDLKQMASQTVGEIWAVAHSQTYKEPARLAAAGYLSELQEQTGRRRKLYSITAKGKTALSDWLRSETSETWELRYPALLKLAFGADPQAIASAQVAAHEERLHELESLAATLELAGADEGLKLVAELGISHLKQDVRFWRGLVKKA